MHQCNIEKTNWVPSVFLSAFLVGKPSGTMKSFLKFCCSILLASVSVASNLNDGHFHLLTSDEIDKIPDPPDNSAEGIEINVLLGNNGDDEFAILEMHEGFGERKETEDIPTKFQRRKRRLAVKDEARSRSKRLVVSGDYRRWPYNIVPYKFDDKIQGNKERRDLILQAMKEWQAVTCIRFEPSTPGIQRWVGHSQKMSFNSSESTCWAYIGFIDPERYGPDKNNTVNLGENCFHKRIILHEIGHALGLKHQQVRPDRDKYLIVNKSIIQEDEWDQYEIPEVGTYVAMERRVPYDYNSIMHYGKSFFVKKDKNDIPLGFAMRPREPCYLDVIGTARVIGFYDAKLINNMYRCSARCRRNLCNPLQIQKNCYTVAVMRHCTCICPDNTDDKCLGVGKDFPCPNSDDFKCSNGYCIRLARKCDGIDHCGNGDDETESTCGGICPRGDMNPNLDIDDKPYDSCAELFKGFPALSCTEYRDTCCLTCLNSTLPCRDWPPCKTLSTSYCEFANVQNNCPLLCGKVQPGQHYCNLPHSCKQDDGAIKFNDGLKSYTSCADVYKKYPTYTCTQMRDACCKTCAEATHPCSDLSSCDSLSSDDCRFTSVQNDCPLKCGKVEHDEFKCSKPRTLIDVSINIILRRNTYKTCASLFKRLPNFACTSHRENCALTCAQATTPCRDASWCASRATRFCKYAMMRNNCPVKCEVAQKDEPICGK